MIHPPVPPAAWAAEGARVAGALAEVAAAVIVGRDAEAAALVAIGIARAQRQDRRCAIGDLTGGTGPLRVPGAMGLAECVRDGRPISEIARPLADDDRTFLLPAGDAAGDPIQIFTSPRWPRLIAGFREMDALLLLVATVDAPRLDALIAEVDGVVAVDLPVALTRGFPLLGTADRPEDELPPIPRSMPDLGTAQGVGAGRAGATGRAGAPPRRTGRRLGRRIALALVLGALATAAALSISRRRAATDAAGNAGPAPSGAGAASSAPTGAATSPSAGGSPASDDDREAPVRADTITLGAVVNPGDSARAATFAIELVAANTSSGANSALTTRGLRLPAPTLAPVPLGSDGRPWFRALTGAWRDRAEAEAFLADLRDRGLVRPTVGRVLRAPYALQLARGVPPEDVPAALAGWAERGVPAYALLQDDGRARIYVGAFETSGQSVLLAASLRDLGVAPVVAFRTGRTF